MNSAIQFVIGLFVLVIGEIIIYSVVMASDLPIILKWLFIIVIPVVAIAGIIKSLNR